MDIDWEILLTLMGFKIGLFLFSEQNARIRVITYFAGCCWGEL